MCSFILAMPEAILIAQLFWYFRTFISSNLFCFLFIHFIFIWCAMDLIPFLWAGAERDFYDWGVVSGYLLLVRSRSLKGGGSELLQLWNLTFSGWGTCAATSPHASVSSCVHWSAWLLTTFDFFYPSVHMIWAVLLGVSEKKTAAVRAFPELAWQSQRTYGVRNEWLTCDRS